MRDAENFYMFIESLPEKLVEFGERGNPGNSTQVDFAKFEPTEAEITVASRWEHGHRNLGFLSLSLRLRLLA
jgi:hypothetical protein